MNTLLLEVTQLVLTLAFAAFTFHRGYQQARRRYSRKMAAARVAGYECGYRHGKAVATQPRGPGGRWTRKPTIAPIFHPVILKPKSLRK